MSRSPIRRDTSPVPLSFSPSRRASVVFSSSPEASRARLRPLDVSIITAAAAAADQADSPPPQERSAKEYSVKGDGMQTKKSAARSALDYDIAPLSHVSPVRSVNLAKQLSRDTPIPGFRDSDKDDERLFEQRVREIQAREQRMGRTPSPLRFREYDPDAFYRQRHHSPSPDLRRMVGRETPPVTAPTLALSDAQYEPNYTLVDRRMPVVQMAKQLPRQELPTLPARSDTVYDTERGRRLTEPRTGADLDFGRKVGRTTPRATAGAHLVYNLRPELIESHRAEVKIGMESNPRDDDSVTGVLQSADNAVRVARAAVRKLRREARKLAAEAGAESSAKAGSPERPASRSVPSGGSPSRTTGKLLSTTDNVAVQNATATRLREILEELGLDGTLKSFPQWAPFSAAMLNRFAPKPGDASDSRAGAAGTAAGSSPVRVR